MVISAGGNGNLYEYLPLVTIVTHAILSGRIACVVHHIDITDAIAPPFNSVSFHVLLQSQETVYFIIKLIIAAVTNSCMHNVPSNFFQYGLK